jgi:hypothetical protein
MPISAAAASTTAPSTLTVSSHNYTSSSFGPGTSDVSHGPPFKSSHVLDSGHTPAAPQGASTQMHAAGVPPVWHSNPVAAPSCNAVGATAFGLPREGVPMPPAAPVGAPPPAMLATTVPGHQTAAQPLSMYSDIGVNRSSSVAAAAPGVGLPQQVSLF